MNHIANLQQKALVTLGTFFLLELSCLGKHKYCISQLSLSPVLVINILKSCIKSFHRKSNQDPHQVHLVIKKRKHLLSPDSTRLYNSHPDTLNQQAKTILYPDTPDMVYYHLQVFLRLPQDWLPWWAKWIQTLLSELTPNNCYWLLL